MLSWFNTKSRFYQCRLLLCASLKTRPAIDPLKEVKEDFKEGAEVEGFLVNKVAPVPEFNMTVVRLRHVRTGCDYMHLARDDINNVFSACFRTTPLNSSGVAHVLEHCVLCGSAKYPCRDPFFRMMDRSMATFMNAMTGPDYTLYPFATQNRLDFKNLLAVYMDAVFRPQLRSNDFYQEGWRFEHDTPNDRESPIVIKGVVYNEMKGVFADNKAVFSNALLNNLLPSHTYGVISGGDPKVIPTLTHVELGEFHKKYYHPSNCRLYSYGSVPLVNTLRFINSEYLEEFPDTTDYAKTTKVPQEPRWEKEKRKHIFGRPDPLACDPKKQSLVAIATLCNDIKAIQETFTMQVISELLINGNNSSFNKSLIESNIGTRFSPITGYDSQTRDSFFSVGLSGIDPNDSDKVVDIYHKTINSIIDDGFDDTSIKAIMHTIELSTRHQTTNFGLDMLFHINPIWNHDGDVTKAIKIQDKVAKLRKSLTDNPLHLQDMVSEYLKLNQHRLILTMSPDMDFDLKEADADKECLDERLSTLNAASKESIYEQTLNIQADREVKPDFGCLPSLVVSDISPEIERVSLKGFTIQNVPVQVCNLPTNGITYIRGILNTSILSEDAKSLLPLFCISATKMGTKHSNCQQMEQQLQLRTGRLSFGTHVAENIYDSSSYEEGVSFSSMCLDRNAKTMMEIWKEIFSSVNFHDVNRFRTVVKETAEGINHDLTASGDLYAISVASSQISPPAFRKEQYGGIQFLKKMRELSSKMNLTDTRETMVGIAEIILKKRLIRIAVNTEVNHENTVLSAIDRFLGGIPGDYRKSYSITKGNLENNVNKSLHYNIPLPVSYTAQCYSTVAYTHPDFPILRLAGRLLTSKYCQPKIKHKNGAYSSSATISTSGVLSISSFRDPKPLASFDVYKKAKSWLESGEFSSSDVEEAKLGVFQSMDTPVPSGSKGVRNFLFGISDDELQRHRDVIMGAKKEDLVRVATHINTNRQARCLIGPANDIVNSNPEDSWETCFAD